MKWIREALRYMVHDRNYFRMMQRASGRRFFWVAGHPIRLGVPSLDSMQKVNDIFSKVVDQMRQDGRLPADKSSSIVPVLDISFVTQRARSFGLLSRDKQTATPLLRIDGFGNRVGGHYCEGINDVASLLPKGTFKFAPPIHEIGLRCLKRVGLGLPDPREKADFSKTPNTGCEDLIDE